MLFASKNPPKNLSKTRPGERKNRCRKRVVFQHRFFHVLGSILGGFGLPRWSQDGPKWRAKFMTVAPRSAFKSNLFSKTRFGALRPRFWSPGPRFWRPWASILEGLGLQMGSFKVAGRQKRRDLPRTCRDMAAQRESVS